MRNAINRIESFYLKLHNFERKAFILVILTVILASAFLAFFILTPKNSVIYYDGNAEEVYLDMSAKMLQIEARESPDSGRILFYNDTENSKSPICAINQATIPPTMPDASDPFELVDAQTFPFVEGTATLLSNHYLELTMDSPDDSYFPYSLSITRQDSGDGFKNYITIENFPENVKIYVRSESEIEMYGNVSDSHMDAGRYRITGCSSIAFPMCSEALQSTAGIRANGTNVSDGKVISFRFKNADRQIFEFTVDSTTEFKEIGHIELAGTAQCDGSVGVIFSDMGEYPIPLTLAGSVGKLSMAEHSFYLTGEQWLRTNMTPILLALVSVIFSVIFSKPSEPSETAE